LTGAVWGVPARDDEDRVQNKRASSRDEQMNLPIHQAGRVQELTFLFCRGGSGVYRDSGQASSGTRRIGATEGTGYLGIINGQKFLVVLAREGPYAEKSPARFFPTQINWQFS